MSYPIEFKVYFSYTVLILLIKDIWLVIYHLVYKDIVNLAKHDLRLWISSRDWRNYQWWVVSSLLTFVIFTVNLYLSSYIIVMIIWNLTFKWRWSKRVSILYEQWDRIYKKWDYHSSILLDTLKFTVILSVWQWLHFHPVVNFNTLVSSPWLLELREFVLLPVLPYTEAPRYLILTLEAFSFIYYRWITPYIVDDYKLVNRWFIYQLYSGLIFLELVSFCMEFF